MTIETRFDIGDKVRVKATRDVVMVRAVTAFREEGVESDRVVYRLRFPEGDIVFAESELGPVE